MVKTRKSVKEGKKTPDKMAIKMGDGIDMFDDKFGNEFNGKMMQKNSFSKTPNKTPKGRQSMNDKRVSFQVPGGKTPGRTPVNNNNSVTKKQNTPGKLQPFKGMKQNNKPKMNLKQEEEDDDDDDDDDDEDDDEDDDVADLDMDLGDDDDDDDDDEDDDDDDEDDEDEEGMVLKGADDDEDDDDEDDDDDDDDEDEEENFVKNKVQKAVQQKQKTPNKNAMQANSVPTPKSEKKQIQNSVQTPNSVKNEKLSSQTPGSVKKEKNSAQSPVLNKKASPEAMINTQDEMERRRERDNRQLFIGNVPCDATAEELKKLSSDIISVVMPLRARQKNGFAFLQFASEAIAEKNFEILKKTTFRGEPLKVDYAGAKSLHNKKDSLPTENFTYNLRKLYVTNIPMGASLYEVAKFFPKSNQICFNRSSLFRTAVVFFDKEEDANLAFANTRDIDINGQKLSVLHALSNPNAAKKRKGPRKHIRKGNQNPAKRMKMAMKDDTDSD